MDARKAKFSISIKSLQQDSSQQRCAVEMARAANSPVFGPSATVLKQSASNFFSDDVIPGRYGPLQSAFCFLQSFII